jgi:hypothetical protein
MRQLQLGVQIHRKAGRLLAIPAMALFNGRWAGQAGIQRLGPYLRALDSSSLE